MWLIDVTYFCCLHYFNNYFKSNYLTMEFLVKNYITHDSAMKSLPIRESKQTTKLPKELFGHTLDYSPINTINYDYCFS